MKYRLSDIAEFNPRESIKKGSVAKKIAMDKLQPFCRDIPEYEYATFSGGTKFRNGDTIMARITPCLENGKTAKVNILDDGEVGFGSTEYIVFRAKENLADEDYLYYLVCSPLVRDPAIKSMVGSSGRQRVQTDVVQNLEIDIPDLDTQKKIGGILRTFDNKIALNNAINENLEQQVQAIFRSRFLTQEALHDGWVKSTLGDVSIMGAGGDKPKTVSATQTENCPYPIYSNGISDEGLYGFTNEYKIEDESITVSARGTIGYVCLRHLPYTPIVRLVTLIPKKEVVSAKYLYLWLRNTHIHGTGTTQQQLTVPDFRKTEIILPTKEEMVSFTGVVSPLFETMWANQAENAKLADLRDTLLPRLVSGELDVSDIDL